MNYAEKFNSPLIDNYIYLYHTDEWLLIPEYPDEVYDSMSSTFSRTDALARTSPVFAYSYSGPRTVQVSLNLHRDMVEDLNLNKSNLKVNFVDNEDYVDTLIKRLQSISLPNYNVSNKSVVPPMVALRLGNEIFIKGIVNGSISVRYVKPILDNNKYAQVNITFEITEVEPYDADSVSNLGSFRGITQQFKNGIYKDEGE